MLIHFTWLRLENSTVPENDIMVFQNNMKYNEYKKVAHI